MVPSKEFFPDTFTLQVTLPSSLSEGGVTSTLIDFPKLPVLCIMGSPISSCGRRWPKLWRKEFDLLRRTSSDGQTLNEVRSRGESA